MNTEIDLLKTIIRNSNNNICLRSPIEMEQVCAWEKKYGVKLPEDYFTFLTEIGDGGTIVPITPDCDKLVSFKTYEQDGYSFAGIKKPFTLEKSWMPDWGDTIENAPDNEDKLEKLMAKRWTMIRHDGNLTLAEDKTDNFQRWFLVVTGPCRGEVWLESEFGVLRFPNCTFSKWLQLHLEGKWEDYAEERAVQEQKERERHTTPQERCLELLNKNKYCPKPVATMDEVRAFEAQHGIVLPEDYIEFVTTVANGSRPARSYSHKLYTMQEAGSLGNLDKPFFFQTMKQFREAVIRQYGKYPSYDAMIRLRWNILEPYLDPRTPSEDSLWVPPMLERMNGCLPLRLSTRSQDRTTAFLILNGEFRGQIWGANLRNGIQAYIKHRLANGDKVNVMNYLERCEVCAFGA
ncbi:MAG: SMI1/KNR4 family protein [Clostridiales bacterium]|nr:SMI1/KNR4 family protein [Clostridiales bacterium]